MDIFPVSSSKHKLFLIIRMISVRLFLVIFKCLTGSSEQIVDPD